MPVVVAEDQAADAQRAGHSGDRGERGDRAQLRAERLVGEVIADEIRGIAGCLGVQRGRHQLVPAGDVLGHQAEAKAMRFGAHGQETRVAVVRLQRIWTRTGSASSRVSGGWLSRDQSARTTSRWLEPRSLTRRSPLRFRCYHPDGGGRPTARPRADRSLPVRARARPRMVKRNVLVGMFGAWCSLCWANPGLIQR